jgi:hypothetical protein
VSVCLIYANTCMSFVCARCASMPFKNRAPFSLSLSLSGMEAAGHGCGKITSPRAALRNEKEAEIDPSEMSARTAI